MAFYESIKRADPKISGANVDFHAAAPITCFTYVQSLGIQTVTVHLAYTNPSEEPRNWPVTGRSQGSHLSGACGARSEPAQ
jgi:hypothetical protein